MGAKCTRPSQKKRPKEKVAVLGLSGSGKTSILDKLQFGEAPPTLSLDDRYRIIRNGSETWYFEGSSKDRRQIRYRELHIEDVVLYLDVAGAIFVIDSTNIKELDDALENLNTWVLTHDKMKGKFVMVIANKQEGEKVMSPEVIENSIKEKCSVDSSISLFVMPTSVMTDGSVELAFDYFKLKRDEGIHGRGLIPGAWKTAQMEMEAKMEMEAEMNREKETKKFSALHLLKSALTY